MKVVALKIYRQLLHAAKSIPGLTHESQVLHQHFIAVVRREFRKPCDTSDQQKRVDSARAVVRGVTELNSAHRDDELWQILAASARGHGNTAYQHALTRSFIKRCVSLLRD